MEKAKERIALVVVIVTIIAVPVLVWYYEEVFIPSQYGPDATVIRLYVTTDGWTTERITALNYVRKEYEPAALSLRPGERTILRITGGDVYHGFGFKIRGGVRINEKISPGQLTTVELNIEEEGSYKFSCTIECGEGHSDLVSEFVVERPDT